MSEETYRYFSQREVRFLDAAVARLILGPSMNLQAPPNLTQDYGRLLDAVGHVARGSAHALMLRDVVEEFEVMDVEHGGTG